MNKTTEGSVRGKFAYRPEIDGLRAFAVIAVIVNHFNKSVLPSGFLGVDVFFVISGYVITLSLINQAQFSPQAFLSGFYARRVKRLLPALIVFVLLSSVLICFVNPNPSASLRTGVAALFGFSNLYLYKQSTDYFSEASEMNVFTHTWSLGVEEQFYLLYPLIFWLAVKWGSTKQQLIRFLATVVALLSVVSLASFLFLWFEHPTGSYFLMSSRLWELGSGCLIAFEQEAKNPTNRLGRNIPATLILLAICIVFFAPQNYGWLTTPVMIVLSVLVIRSLKPSTAAYSLLTNQKVLLIGLISYSLYLWHWVVLCLSRWSIGIQWWTIPIQAVLIFALAMLSYQYIESPIRHSSKQLSNRYLIGFGVASSASVAAIIGMGIYQRGSILYRMANPSTGLNPLYISQPYVPEKEGINTLTCSNPDPKQLEASMARCTLLPTGKKNMFYFIGDSQSNHLKALAGKLQQHLGAGSQLLAISSMPFPTGYYWISGKGDLLRAKEDANTQQVLVNHSLEKAKAGDVFILSGRYLAYFSDYKIPIHQREMNIKRYLLTGKEVSDQQALADWVQRLDLFVKDAARRNVNVILMLPFPEFPYSGPQCIGTFSKINPSPLCRQSKEGLKTRSKTIVAMIKRIAQANKNLYLFDPVQSLCPEDINCKTTDGDGKLLYYDATHLSVYGAQHLSIDFIEFLKKHNLI
jgi:peptidoglycan/LPS O-acetylase OafA/YrhL